MDTVHTGKSIRLVIYLYDYCILFYIIIILYIIYTRRLFDVVGR